MDGKYRNKFYWDNVYGHAVTLLQESGRKNGLHLDIGCGFGEIAEVVKSELHMEYVGVDADQEGLSDLGSRGFEAHRHFFDDSEEDYAFLKRIIGDRSVASISIMDMLEHLAHPENILSVLQRIALEHHALLILSVPNVTHKDIAYKLLAGRFDYTDAGLLDCTHLSFFSEARLNRITKETGWCEVAQKNKYMEQSDQHFPEDHIFLAESSLVHSYLDWIDSHANPSSTVNQFVRAYLPIPLTDSDKMPDEKGKPFLSIVTRTQGKRPSCLREVFLCLAAQKDIDFEVLVMGHKLNLEKQLSVEKLIDDNPEWLRKKIRLIKVDNGNRTTPLNVGFEQAKGEYISILDDDDVVFENWVETFHDLSVKKPGEVLHANCVRQDWTPVRTIFGESTVRACSTPNAMYTSEFNLLRQIYENQCPPVTLAFPASAFQDLGVRFDEELTTTEDWDFLMRTAFVCGVADDSAITSLYRWWVNGENSSTEHKPDEWKRNYERIQTKFDRLPILLPPGYASQLSGLVKEKEYRGEPVVTSKIVEPSNVALNTVLYLDSGKGFNEEELLFETSSAEYPNFDVSFELADRGAIRRIRWDPADGAGLFFESFSAQVHYKSGKLQKFSIRDVQTNGIKFNRYIWFPEIDPQVIVPLGEGGDPINYVKFEGILYLSIPGEYAVEFYHQSAGRYFRRGKQLGRKVISRIRSRFCKK